MAKKKGKKEKKQPEPDGVPVSDEKPEPQPRPWRGEQNADYPSEDVTRGGEHGAKG